VGCTMTKRNPDRIFRCLRFATLVMLVSWWQQPARGERPVDAGGAAWQREEVFEFTQPPSFRKVGQDGYEIQLAAKGFCDVTVAIVDAQGKIVRHWVSGVLGPNAPEPLIKDSLEQRFTWDGKNDVGRFVDTPEACRVRVALGLKPVFDKTLLWHP